MDPVSHILFGRTLHALDRNARLGPGLGGVFLVGSVIPDADTALLFARGPDVYLRYHDTGTHSLAGTFACAALLTIVWSRLFPGRSRPIAVFVAAWVATLGHVFWDVASGADIRLFAPVWSRPVGWHLVAMAEPIVTLILAAGVLLAWWRPGQRARAATAAICVIAALLLVKMHLQGEALAAYYRAVPAASQAETRIDAEWASLTGWDVYERRPREVRVWSVDPWKGSVHLLLSLPVAPDGGAVTASRELPVVRNFLLQASIPFARLEARGSGVAVLWSDLEACDASGCAVEFGAVFDAALRPLYETIRFGPVHRRVGFDRLPSNPVTWRDPHGLPEAASRE